MTSRFLDIPVYFCLPTQFLTKEDISQVNITNVRFLLLLKKNFCWNWPHFLMHVSMTYEEDKRKLYYVIDSFLSKVFIQRSINHYREKK